MDGNSSESMSIKEMELRKKIAEYVSRKNAYKNFDEQVHERILGQKNLSEITYNVFMWLRGLAENSELRNNAMIVAPSGCGKTETYRTIRDILKDEIANIPVIQLDVTKLTAEGFKGMDTNDFFAPLFNDSVNGIAIVVLDEIDKRLLPDHNYKGDNINASIQSQLLTLIEGTELRGKVDGEEVVINTLNTLFVVAGAFQIIRDKRKEKQKKNLMNSVNIGFQSNVIQKSEASSLEDEDITLEEIIENGAMYEFMGRFATIINLHKLDFESVKTIVNRYISEYGKLLKCNIIFEDSVAKDLYENYLTSGLGCRTLKNQIWNRICPIGIEIERNNHANTGEDIKIICGTRGDMYVLNDTIYKIKKEHAA